MRRQGLGTGDRAESFFFWELEFLVRARKTWQRSEQGKSVGIRKLVGN